MVKKDDILGENATGEGENRIEIKGSRTVL